MKQPKFSICIPNYNYAQYVGETIQSVLDRIYPHFEIIIADNASTDNSVEVVNSFQDERIHLIQNRYNIGFAPNLQQVARQAKNDFMLMLSSDDRMLPEALEVYSSILNTQDEAAFRTILFSEAYQINSNGLQTDYSVLQPSFYLDLKGIEKKTSDSRKYYIYDGKDILREAIGRLGPAGPFLTMSYPRKMYDAVEGYNSIHLTDPDAHFTHKILGLYPQVVWVKQPLFEYRVHNLNQLDLQRKQGSIKKPIDKYLHTLEIPEKQLEDLGLSRQELIRTFVNNYCINASFHYLAHGSYQLAFKGLMFAITTYPGEVLQSRRAYLLLLLLMLGPLSGHATRFVRDLYRLLGGSD